MTGYANSSRVKPCISVLDKYDDAPAAATYRLWDQPPNHHENPPSKGVTACLAVL
jgi:hypothetical protein